MSTTSPSSRRSQSGSARPILILLLAVVMFAAGAATSWWYLTQPGVLTATVASPSPSAAPDFGPLTPSTLAGAPETHATAPAGETAPAGPAAGGAGAPASVPAAPAGGGGATAPTRRAGRPPAAVTPAPVVPAPPPAALAGAGRNFVLGTTVVESLRSVGRDLQGFDTSDVGVKRAPKVEGLLDLVILPAALKAGDPYSVQVFLKNEGKKAIEVDEIKVSMIVDGKWSTRPLPPKVKQVPAKQRVLLEELPGIWKGGVNDWAVEAVVTSKNQDVYRNRLTWK
jgi:hypothetical protein